MDLLEWTLKTEKISMKDNDQDEYFQRVKLDEIKEESKKEIDKIIESIITKE